MPARKKPKFEETKKVVDYIIKIISFFSLSVFMFTDKFHNLGDTAQSGIIIIYGILVVREGFLLAIEKIKG